MSKIIIFSNMEKALRPTKRAPWPTGWETLLYSSGSQPRGRKIRNPVTGHGIFWKNYRVFRKFKNHCFHGPFLDFLARFVANITQKLVSRGQSISLMFYTRVFRQCPFAKKSQSWSIIREKLQNLLLYKKRARKMLVKLTLGVNFINIIRTNFLYEYRFSSYVLALLKNSYENRACIMLMKLTIGEIMFVRWRR